MLVLPSHTMLPSQASNNNTGMKKGFSSKHLFLSQRSISQNVPANSPLHHLAKISWTTNGISDLRAKKILGIRRILTNYFPERLYTILLLAPVYPTFIGLILHKK